MHSGETALFVGEGSLLTQAAERWLAAGFGIVGIVAQEPGIVEFADARGIPVLTPGDHAALAALAARRPFTTLLSVANVTMLPAEVLRLASRRAINFHDGPLPRYAGLYATTWAILHGEPTHGVTWHEMTATADTGRILVQRRIEVAPDETAMSLNAKCYAAGIDSFEELVARLSSGTLEPVVQDLAGRSYFGRRDRPGTACLLDWASTAESIAAQVRALDFGTYANPVGCARVLTSEGLLLVGACAVREGSGVPGTVLAVEADALLVATASGAVRLTRLQRPDGEPVVLPAAGTRLPLLADAEREQVAARSRAVVGDEPHFQRALQALTLPALPLAPSAGAPAAAFAPSIPAALGAAGGEAVLAAMLAFVARLAGTDAFDVGLSEPRLDATSVGARQLFSEAVPVRVQVAPDDALATLRQAVGASLAAARARSTFLHDLLVRQPALRAVARRAGGVAWTVAVRLDAAVGDVPGAVRGDVTIAVAPDGSAARWHLAPGVADRAAVDGLAAQLDVFLARVAAAPDTPLGRIPRLTPEEERAVRAVNETGAHCPATTVHALIEARAASHPDTVALRFRDRTLTYRELDERANTVAHALRARGVGPDVLVGIYASRSPEMVIAALAIWKAGGAYVPLDPSYPRDRIAFMVSDARLPLILTQRALVPQVPGGSAKVIAIDEGEWSGATGRRADGGARPEHLAYVIYTSGSTGTPKGVMVEHRNVVNHFVGMDARLDYDGTPGTWLAVTSLSFDISVLELFWTLARGYTVVLYREPTRAVAQRAGAGAGAPALDMSLFYFSSDEAERAGDKYRLLLDGARFADTNGFVAVWTPERHFHAFGGLFPNPAVTSAAVASITSRVSLRAGSCVAPLHSPIRIAEDWSVVDNISGGRAGIAFAAGWQPNDFVIRPEGFADRKNQMFRDLELVRRLWRGETIPFPDATGREVPVSIYPRPVQRELPFWVTIAGNPETFEEAGRVGANVLTHLLGQSVAELTEKIAIYRKAWTDAGHAGRGSVALMLHTFVGPDAEMAKETVRAPMKAYLSSAVGLVKAAAWSFPTFKSGSMSQDGSFSIDHLGPEEMDALLDHAFERYYESSGLFGTVDMALAFAERVRECDVDEIACLIDFGVASDVVLDHLPLLAEVRARAALAAQVAAEEGDDAPIDVLIARHGVTHLQCTPSMAMMLTRDEGTRQALARLDTMLVGGEALAPSLARDLRALVARRVINVYGPTETTIWSTAWEVPADAGEISIGTPLANTDVLVLDSALQPSPIGTIGELAIGGLGVTRGYLDRPELTTARFIPHPWRAAERLYRTGDLVRQRPDGTLDFLGRLDHQVKVRGYRIELGEIEARLLQHPSVREAVVVAREDSAGDARLVGYLIARDGERATNEELQATLAATLPAFMVPSAFVWLARWPLTPNGKLDRKALPRPEQPRAAAAAPSAAPTGELERAIAAHWCEVLGVPSVGIDDNFFDLGGHSLLTVQLLARLKPLATGPLSLVDLFRFPTVRQLARFMGEGGAKPAGGDDSVARVEARQEGAQRRAALAQRRRGVS